MSGVKAPDGTMSGPELQMFMAEMRAVFTIVSAVDQARVERAIRTFEYALLIGPFADPTAYMQGAANTAEIIDLLKALARMRKKIAEAKGEA